MMMKSILLTVSTLLVSANAEISLGVLADSKAKMDMGVGGEIVVLSDRVVEVRDFTYNGMAPDGLFWADVAEEPTADGFQLIPASMNCTKDSMGEMFGNETIRLEFPEGKSIQDIPGGSIALWCRIMSVNMGKVVIPASLSEDLLSAAYLEPVVCSPQNLSLWQSFLSRANLIYDTVRYLIF